MITVLSRPLGHILNDTELSAIISNDSGEALVTTSFSHALFTGSYVYVQSRISTYNGFKHVTVVSPTEFKISDSSGSGIIPFVQSIFIIYQVSESRHTVISANQPIVYELYNNLFPTNVSEESYVPAVVSSQANENGYTKLILSGNLSSNNPLSWIQIAGTYYQIINAISSSQVVINLAYDAANVFTGPVTTYYNNYAINVNVWAGYLPTHPWYDYKPIELVQTLRLVPDENNEVKFSISEIVKSYIKTRNNLTLDTLPNNTDFSAQFYIEYFESYDQSDGLEVTTFTGTVTSDESEFVGLGVNSVMPFKSQAITHMSEYLKNDNQLARWLTLQDTMIWIKGLFFDLSFILYQYLYDSIEVWTNGEVSETIDNPGDGIVRIPLRFTEAGEYCVQVYSPAIPAVPGYNFLKSAMLNCDGTWTIGPTPSVTLATLTDSGYLADTFLSVPGIDYSFSYSIDITASAGTPLTKVEIALLDDDCNVLDSDSDNHFSGGTITGTQTVNASSYGTKVGIKITNLTVPNTKTYDLTDMDFLGSAAVDAAPITESYCITVVEECDNTIIPDMDDARLLEDGDFRLLE